MTTERIYREDPYTVSIRAVATEVIKGDGYYDIVFDRTVFFPEGGGQPSDTGYITCDDDTVYNVVLAHDKSLDGPVYHRVKTGGGPGEAPADGSQEFGIKAGDTVTLDLDFDVRFRNMQRHSGEHILSGAFYLTIGGANKGFHMGADYITIDIDLGGRAVTPEEVKLVERRANEAIWDNLPFSTVFYPDAASANTAPVRKVVDLEGVISVVFVGDHEDPFDCVACCGTHVSTAGEIGLIKIQKVEMNKGFNRVYFDCGAAAYEKMCDETDTLTAIANHYSTSKDNILHKIEVEEDKAKAMRETVASLTSYYRTQRAKDFEELFKADGCSGAVHIPADELTVDDLQKFGFACIERVAPADALVIVTHESSHTAVLVSSGDKYHCGQLIKEHAFACGGKGGGRNDNARAVFPGTREMKQFISLLV